MESENHLHNDYRQLITEFQTLLLDAGYHRDWIHEAVSLTNYKILFTPFVSHLSDQFIDKCETFVRTGGTWIVGPLTNYRSGEHTAYTDAALGKRLEELAGIRTDYFVPLQNSGASGLAFGIEAPLKLLSSVYTPVEAETVGTIKGSVAHGKSFICQRSLDKGRIVSLGSLPYDKQGKEMLIKLIQHYATVSEVTAPVKVAHGTVAVPRTNETSSYWVVINSRDHESEFTLESPMTEYFDSTPYAKGTHRLAPFEYLVLEENKK